MQDIGRWAMRVMRFALCLWLVTLPLGCDTSDDDSDTTAENTTDTTPPADNTDTTEPPPANTGSDFIDSTYFGTIRGTEAGDEAFSINFDQNKWLVYGPYTSVRYSGQADGTFTWPNIAFTVDMTGNQPGLPAKKIHFTGLVDRTGKVLSGTWTAVSGVAGSGAWNATAE